MADCDNIHARRGRTRYPGMIDCKALSCFPSITDMVLDLNSALGLWQDAGKTVPADGDDDLVYVWDDQSGAGYDFTQATDTLRPLLKVDIVGNHDAVLFDGVDDYMSRASAVYGSQYATVFLVVYLSSVSERGVIFGVGNTANGWKIGPGSNNFETVGNDLIILFDGVKWVDTNDPIGTGVHLITVQLDNYVPTWYIDGVLSGTTTGSPKATAAVSYIGSGALYSNRYYTDYLVRAVASSSAISAAERTSMENYLMRIYGIT